MTQNLFINKRELKYWSLIFERLYKENKPDSWAYRWFLVCQAYGALNILPNENLVNNIGFSSNATHTKEGESPIKLNFRHDQPTGLLPIKEPSFIIRSFDADNFTFMNYFKPRLHIKLLNKIKFLFKKIKNNF